MKVVVRKKVAAFFPQAFIDSHNAHSIIHRDEVQFALKDRGVKLLLVSLKRVIFFNVNGLRIVIDHLRKIRKETSSSIGIGLCDYDEKKYEIIRKFFSSELDFSLFITFQSATLFTSNSVGKESILIWNDSYEQRNIQSLELFEKGYNPTVAHRPSDYQKHLRSRSYDYVVINTYIGSAESGTPFARISGNAVIYALDGYLDSSIDKKFDFNYHHKALKTGYKLFIFDMKEVIGLNIKIKFFFERLFRDNEHISIAIANLRDSSSINKIRDDLEEYGIHIFSSLEELLGDKEKLKELGGHVEDHTEHRSVTKELINYLPNFLNSTVSTLEMMLDVSAVKTSTASIQQLNTPKKGKKLASSIGFYGDLEGIIILIFPYSLAKKSCSIMLGDEIHHLSEVLDSLGEFVNIIAGRVKTKLEAEDTQITITLPRTYSSVEELHEALSIKSRGVQIDLDFEDDRFTFFLTR
jgi:CheY-specific phosphatase CheX